MTILAIDPGPTHSALVVWDGAVIKRAEKVENTWLIKVIGTLCHIHGADSVVCERIESYGMAVGREVFDTCFWTGRFWQNAQLHVSFHLVPRRAVKLHLCGQARAKDSNIRQALVDRFGGKGTKAAPGLTYNLKADTWQAFALAVVCHDNPSLLKSDQQPAAEEGGR